MQVKRIAQVLGLCVLIGTSLLAVRADEPVVPSGETGVQPDGTVIIKQQFNFGSGPPMEGAAIKRTTQETVNTPGGTKTVQTQTIAPASVPSAAAVQTETTVNVERRLATQNRLTLLKEQIDLGVSKGWLSSSQADGFRSKADELASMSQRSKDQPDDRSLADDVEHQMNALNIAVTSAMKGSASKTP